MPDRALQRPGPPPGEHPISSDHHRKTAKPPFARPCRRSLPPPPVLTRHRPPPRQSPSRRRDTPHRRRQRPPKRNNPHSRPLQAGGSVQSGLCAVAPTLAIAAAPRHATPHKPLDSVPVQGLAPGPRHHSARYRTSGSASRRYRPAQATLSAGRTVNDGESGGRGQKYARARSGRAVGEAALGAALGTGAAHVMALRPVGAEQVMDERAPQRGYGGADRRSLSVVRHRTGLVSCFLGLVHLPRGWVHRVGMAGIC
jgi:hypothetical protein